MSKSPEIDEAAQMRDEVRCDAAVQTLKDVLWRSEELSEGTFNLYDLVGFLVEDLVREGCCAACVQESVNAAFQQLGVDPTEHKPEDAGEVFH